jgi:hypothetical protein
VDARFTNNGLARLVSGLRDVTMHCRNPIVTYSQNVLIDCNGPSMISDVFLRQHELLTYDRLNAAARNFLESSGDTISLESMIRTYHEMVVIFHDWFSARQHEIHGESFGHLERIEQELREIKAAEKSYFDALLSPAQNDTSG